MRPAADLAAAAEQAAAAAHKAEKATAQQLEVAAKAAEAARQEANPTREPRVAHTVAIHTALGPVACPLPHRSLPVPPQFACGLAHMRGVAAGTLISLAIAQSHGPARELQAWHMAAA